MNLKRIITLEEKLKFDDALIQLNSLIRKEKNKIRKENLNGYKNRLIERIEAQNPYDKITIKQLFPNLKIINEDKAAPVVSLTAISTRRNGLIKTIDSILKQSLKPSSINMFVSAEPFLVDKGFDAEDEILKELYEKGVNIFFTENLGPYRKQLPIIKYLRSNSYPEDTTFITFDDDVIYPETTIELLVAHLENTDSVTAYRGREIVLSGSKIAKYKSFRTPQKNTSVFNLGTGKNGIAYRLNFFPSDSNFFIGSLLAPTADDIWCKWITGMYCIDTTILEPTAAFDKTKDFEETSPDDKVGLFHVFNAKGRNDVAIEALELYFNAKGKDLYSILAGLKK